MEGNMRFVDVEMKFRLDSIPSMREGGGRHS